MPKIVIAKWAITSMKLMSKIKTITPNAIWEGFKFTFYPIFFNGSNPIRSSSMSDRTELNS